MIKYKLFQVKNDLTRNYGFMGLSFLKNMSIEVDLKNYDLVYQGEIEENDSTLNELFKMFNTRHPEDYYGRSMSVSDIVKLDNDYYYCDSFGWEKIKPNNQMDLTIKDWYINAFPTDELGYELNNNVTFKGLFEALDNYKDVYEFMGVHDSIVRERVFGKLSEIMEVDYSYIYNQWLEG